jgi:hypothetical protein
VQGAFPRRRRHSCRLSLACYRGGRGPRLRPVCRESGMCCALGGIAP